MWAQMVDIIDILIEHLGHEDQEPDVAAVTALGCLVRLGSSLRDRQRPHPRHLGA